MVTFLDHQAVVAGQIRQALRRAAPGKIVRRRTQHPPVACQALGDQVRGNLVTHADIQIAALGRQVHQAVMHVQAYVQPWVARRQRRQRRRHHPPPQAQAAGDAQLPGRLTLAGVQIIAHALQCLEDLLRPLIDPLTLLAHRHPPGGAVQQAHAEVRFEQADALADEGSRHATGLGHRRKARTAGYLKKDIEVVKAW